ncbi:MAG: ABC transporter ATP-binding protein [Alphaproteobacteria bacterium]|nr:ABC transporter ATP-binding protein [Alphaproteobacteria bacterium]
MPDRLVVTPGNAAALASAHSGAWTAGDEGAATPPRGRIVRCSITTGRQRWHVADLRDRPAFAQALEVSLLEVPGVLEVRATPLTARVLLAFDESVLAPGLIERLLIDHVDRLRRAPEKPVPRTGHPLMRLAKLNPQLRPQLVRATGWSVANAVSALLTPIGLANIIITVQLSGNPLLVPLGLVSIKAQLAAVGLFTIGAIGLNLYLQYRARRHWSAVGLRLEHELRSELFTTVVNADMAFIETQSTGSLISLVNEDSRKIGEFVQRGVNDGIQIGIVTVTVGSLLLMTSPLLAALAFLPLGAGLMLAKAPAVQRRLGASFGASRDKESEVLHHLSAGLGGVSTVKSFVAEEVEALRIESLSKDATALTDAATGAGVGLAFTAQALVLSGFIASTVASGAMVVTGAASLPQFTKLLFLNYMMTGSLTKLDTTVELYRGATAAARRALETLSREPTVVSGGRALPLDEVRGDIAFDRVSFNYPTGNAPLAEIDFRLAAGQTAGFVGSTGAGKSTLIKLLLRFYDVQSGQVTIDGHDVRDLELIDLRSAIGVVAQEGYLFGGTVYDNIAYGKPNATHGEVMEAAAAAEAYDFIRALPDGFNSLIGERGQILSGGQRQRICIARALIRNPPILVFDEATSALDSETEAAVQRSIERLSEGRTTILISHRLSTLRKADQIYVISEGHIVERGQHADLVEAGGVYAGMWRVQTGA